LATSAENTGGVRCYRHALPDTLLGRKQTQFAIADRLRTDRLAKQVRRWPTNSSASPSGPKSPIGSPTPAGAPRNTAARDNRIVDLADETATEATNPAALPITAAWLALGGSAPRVDTVALHTEQGGTVATNQARRPLWTDRAAGHVDELEAMPDTGAMKRIRLKLGELMLIVVIAGLTLQIGRLVSPLFRRHHLAVVVDSAREVLSGRGNFTPIGRDADHFRGGAPPASPLVTKD
jgi:hypothetical protein